MRILSRFTVSEVFWILKIFRSSKTMETWYLTCQIGCLINCGRSVEMTCALPCSWYLMMIKWLLLCGAITVTPDARGVILLTLQCVQATVHSWSSNTAMLAGLSEQDATSETISVVEPARYDAWWLFPVLESSLAANDIQRCYITSNSAPSFIICP